MVNEPVPAYVHEKLKTINFQKNDQVLQQYLENQGVGYIVIAPVLQSPRSTEISKDAKEIQSQIDALPNSFELVFEDKKNNIRVYLYTGE